MSKYKEKQKELIKQEHNLSSKLSLIHTHTQTWGNVNQTRVLKEKLIINLFTP